MTSQNDEASFLRDLVKTSRQKTGSVEWSDRDGTPRRTTLTPSEMARLNGIASSLRISKAETLRRAAHVPVSKDPERAPADTPPP